MITRIRVQNFLSLKDVKLNLRLRNVLVGPNMSGKSNFLDCLRFVSELIGWRGDMAQTPLSQILFKRGRFDEVLSKASGPTNDRSIRIAFTLEAPSDRSKALTTYEYEVAIARGADAHGEIESETLRIAANGTNQVTLEREKSDLLVQEDNADPPARAANACGPGNSALSQIYLLANQLRDKSKISGFEQFKEIVSGWRFYRLSPEKMRLANPAAQKTSLAEDGGNFSAWLTILQTHRTEFAQLEQVASDAFPELADLLIEPAEDSKLAIGTDEGKLRIHIAHMSDGELVFLGLLSLLLAPKSLVPPLCCIEEPENHLHPLLLETLVNIIKQRQLGLGPHGPQLIATTHSPHFVDKLEIDDLVVVEKVKGESKFTRPSSRKNLKELLSRKELGLGDLWYSGALGGS